MKLEPIIQSEVSQKENHQYSILIQILMIHNLFHLNLENGVWGLKEKMKVNILNFKI